MNESKKPAHWPPDSDLKVKPVVVVGVTLLLATALVAAAVWWLSLAMRTKLEAQDPAPPVLLEAQSDYAPPAPNLETDPAALLETLRAEESELLDTYGWVDEAAGVVRVPIERGMELLLETRPDGLAFGEPTAPADEAAAEVTVGGVE